MEMIPPTDLQSPPAQSIQNPEQNVPEEEQKESIFAFIKTSLFELFLILLFSIIILATFNYFNLIPLSSVFPALSFLPQQQNTQSAVFNAASQDDIAYFSNNFYNLSSCGNTRSDKNIVLNQIVSCNTPKKITNTTKETNYVFVPNTDQIIAGDKGVQINFAIKVNTNGKDDLGLMFGGNPTENRLYIAYYPSQNAWGAQFLLGSKITDFVPTYYPTDTSASQRAFFSLKISADGKTLTLIFPNGDIETFNEGQSFYAKDGTLPITAVIPLNSTMTIYSLNYYIPQ